MGSTFRETWASLREGLHRFAAQDRQRRRQLLFRGQSDTNWPLDTTLDRFKPIADPLKRARLVYELLQEFSREAVQITSRAAPLPEGDALELLARHHGLPSPLLDWTRSPFVAAYFAFEAAGAADRAVWVLDLNRIPPPEFFPVDIIDDHLLLQFNRRALRQQSIFLRVNEAKPLEQIASIALTKFELPSSERGIALAELDAMNINATSLFEDFDGVARAVRTRMS
ncbi:MAG TPA: FRG domain-containing protein [Tepidisphaeraceae bacterium]|nr:FRG domain-containing protein [Tepidisphaeraceae bacterium]